MLHTASLFFIMVSNVGSITILRVHVYHEPVFGS